MSHFNSSAPKWDAPEKVQMMEILASKTISALRHFLTSGKKKDIIDFGCGTGLFGLAFSDYLNTLTGIDTSEGMLAVFNEKTANLPHIRAVFADLEDASFEPELLPLSRADLVISSMAFHHLKQPEVVLGRLKPILAAGGAFAIADLDEEDGTFHPNNVEMEVQHFGFSKTDVERWAQTSHLSLQYDIIHTIHKNDKTYPVFLAIMKNEQ